MIGLTPDHLYVDDETGRTYPGVTSIIKDVGLMGYLPDYDDYYLKRGTYVHEATALWDRGLLEENDLAPGLVWFLAAWKKYRGDTGFTPAPDFIERICFDPVLGYCGTVDRDGVDLKSGVPCAWHVLQASGYWHFAGSTKAPWQSVYLHDDGTYKVKVYAPQELYAAFGVFCAALTLYNWKRENKIQ